MNGRTLHEDATGPHPFGAARPPENPLRLKKTSIPPKIML